MNLTNAQIGFIRGLGVVVVTSVLAYIGDVNHLSGLVSVGVASIISALALSLEHHIEAGGGGALFGAAK